MPTDDTVSAEEMAAMHGLNKRVILRILRADALLPENERVIPGAYKTGDKYRGDWQIPRQIAESYQPRQRGRPKENED